METENKDLPAKPVVEKIKISKYLRNFFFKGFQARPEYKGLQETLGKIETVNLIFAKDKNVLRANTLTEHKDSKMTNEEAEKFLIRLGVKKKTISESTKIIVQLDMNTQFCYIQQTKIDGSKKFFEI